MMLNRWGDSGDSTGIGDATQTGMTNEWLRTQGLVSIRALWMKAYGYA